MHTATWWCRDQRLRETCATQPCVLHGLPDAPLSCWVAQLARRHRTSIVELASRAICDVLAWCPWWTVSRSTRTVSAEVMQRHCVRTVVQTHRVCVKCSVIRCVLFVRGTEWVVPWRLQVKAVIGCVFVYVVGLHSYRPRWIQSCVFVVCFTVTWLVPRLWAV